MSNILEENPWSTPETSTARTTSTTNHEVADDPSILSTDHTNIYTINEPENEYIKAIPIKKMGDLYNTTDLLPPVTPSSGSAIIPTSDPLIASSDLWTTSASSPHLSKASPLDLADSIWGDVPHNPMPAVVEDSEPEKSESVAADNTSEVEKLKRAPDKEESKIPAEPERESRKVEQQFKIEPELPSDESATAEHPVDKPTHRRKISQLYESEVTLNETGVKVEQQANEIKHKDNDNQEEDEDEFDEFEDDNESADDDFGSFESVEQRQMIPLQFSEPEDKILASLMPQASTTFNPPSKANYHDLLNSKPELSKTYELITSRQRHYKYPEIPKSQFRSRSYLDKSPINQEVVKISKKWSKEEKGVYVSEKDQYNKNMSRLNVFQWSTTSHQTTNKSKKDKSGAIRDPKSQVNQKLLKVAFNEARKILEKRKDQQAQMKLKLERERRERELRISQEKKKKDELNKKYSNPSTTTTTATPKKKTFFGSLFGSNKSKIAKDSISHTQVTSPEIEIPKSPDDDDFIFQLNLPTNNQAAKGSNQEAEDNLEFGDFEGSDDEVLGYNQLGSEVPAEIDQSKDEKDEEDEEDDSFGGFLQTPAIPHGHERRLSSLYFDPDQIPTLSLSKDEVKEAVVSNKGDTKEDAIKIQKDSDTGKENINQVKNDATERSANESDDDSFNDFDAASVSELPTLEEQDTVIFDALTARKDTPTTANIDFKQSNKKKAIVAQHKRTSTPIKIDSPALDQYIPKSAALVDRVIDDSSFKLDSDDDDDFSDLVTSPEPEERPLPLSKSQSLIHNVLKPTHTGSSLHTSSSTSSLPISNSATIAASTRSSWTQTPHPLRRSSTGFSEYFNQAPHVSSTNTAPIQGSAPMLLSNLRRKPSVQRKPFIANPNPNVDIPESLVPEISSDISDFYQNTIMSNDDVLIRSGSVSRKSSISRKSSVKRTSSVTKSKTSPKPAQNLIDL